MDKKIVKLAEKYGVSPQLLEKYIKLKENYRSRIDAFFKNFGCTCNREDYLDIEFLQSRKKASIKEDELRERISDLESVLNDGGG